MTRFAAFALLAIAAALAPVTRGHAADGDEPYAVLTPLAGDSHQHSATLVMIERMAKDPPLPYFGAQLHEHSAPGDVYDEMSTGGYDWGSLSHHDTNFPGTMANICMDPSSEKYRWWIAKMDARGFPDATRPGAFVNPPANESLALSKVATSKTVEGTGGFLAFSGREFTNMNFHPTSVGARQAGHKIVILPGETNGMCAADGQLRGDEYCKSESALFTWIAGQSLRPVVLQAHPGAPEHMVLFPYHPRNAPGGFSDQFVQGVEIGSQSLHAVWEPAYQAALHHGYRWFPAYGSDDHNATWPGSSDPISRGATVCWATARTRRALIDAMHARRCYWTSTFEPELRFSARAAGSQTWQAMGSEISAPAGRIDVRIRAKNDPRNRDADPRGGRRFDTLELIDDRGLRVASCGVGAGTPPPGATECGCTRSADGADTCVLSVDSLALHDGAFYPRITMSNFDRPGCTGNCDRIVIGSPIFVNWTTFKAKSDYRWCQLDMNHFPCSTAGCLLVAVDHDQDGWPDDCDTCPAVYDPSQGDVNKDGIGDRCGKEALGPPAMLGVD